MPVSPVPVAFASGLGGLRAQEVNGQAMFYDGPRFQWPLLQVTFLPSLVHDFIQALIPTHRTCSPENKKHREGEKTFKSH